MGCSVRECQARITSAEFRDWQAFFQLEPWDLGQAMIAATLANIFRPKGEPRKKPEDFMPEEPLTPEAELALLGSMFRLRKAG